jgi:hypothetical protein
MTHVISTLAGKARVALRALAFSAASTLVPAQAVEVAGWVEPDPTTQAVPTSAFRLTRAGKTITYPEAGLQACDKLTLADDKAIVRVRLASNLRMQLDASSPGQQIEVPCDQRGIAADLAAALRAMIRGIEQRGRVRVATMTRDIAPLAVPALVASQANIVAGTRALYIAWTGGVGPFSVQVSNAADGREVVRQTTIERHSVRLPVADFAPGNYTLWVRNRAGYRVEGVREDGLVVVTASEVPMLPEVLKSSALSDEARTLFYADYLVGQDDGRWTLEALQRVAALPAQSPAVRQWLFRYGGRED